MNNLLSTTHTVDGCGFASSGCCHAKEDITLERGETAGLDDDAANEFG
ncbi:MAG: hypothetical protein R3C01_04375 [Planctomycetaceae bacterium]